MSYVARGYGGDRRRHGNYDRREDRRPVETEGQRIQKSIFKLGEAAEFLPSSELPVLAKTLRLSLSDNIQSISEGFRTGVTEEPYKIPYFSALFTLLLQPEPDEDVDNTIQELVQSVFNELCKSFQTSLDKLAWRDLRLTIHFFAHLALSKTVSASSMLDLLQSFLIVLDEPGVSYERSQAAALCVGEGLIRAGPILYQYNPTAAATIISTINSSFESAKSQRSLTRPVVRLHDMDVSGVDVFIGALLSTLQTLDESSFASLPPCLPQPHSLFPESNISLDIPAFIVPPEEIELGRSADEGTRRKELMPAARIRLFDDEISPNPSSPSGFIIRSTLADTINIFEVNRKECARIVLELPRWFTWGTFKEKGRAGPEAAVEESAAIMGWALENTILEVTLAEFALLPSPPQTLVYYFALITDLCKLSPQTVGPAVGKSFRKLYSLLGEGLDVEIARRFAEWFASHMSNFGFNWVWKEWIPDLALPAFHPKRCFIRRVIELETRLAYHDRIVKTLPEAFLASEAKCIHETPPGPDFDYDDPQHHFHEPAQSLLNLIRGRSQIDEVIQLAETLRSTIGDTVTLAPETSPDSVVRSITMQILLHVGSRSFSHFLNAIERYLPLLRSLGSTPDDKIDFLNAAGKFWQRNGQMVAIVFDKLMQYQIVDPSDIIAWCFHSSDRREASSEGLIGLQEWDLIKAALDKAIGRVSIAQQRVNSLRKEEEDAKAKVKAGKAELSVDTMDVDSTEANRARDLESNHKTISEALASALKAYSILTREQKTALARVLEGFVTALSVNATPSISLVIAADGWDHRVDWTQVQWECWETWGWYRHFCRYYAAQLKSYAVTLESGPLAKVLTAGDRAHSGMLVSEIWTVALGRGVNM
ncbi:hypothetical protein BS47DRAFT_1331566 [Hydnum rufescens UP504]|uniref:MIF4G like-domain-containing protein n=1 Tax=Hydnum rufescens UP504 TaxID=1448309 RepID=A0A9P6ASB1_9AGAM|nr:hypothetical protein BS47DRAFT_1331566 [Hydnum rufescens UP504]